MGKSYRDTRGKFADHRKSGKLKNKLKIKNKSLKEKEKDEEFYSKYENHVTNYI